MPYNLGMQCHSLYTLYSLHFTASWAGLARRFLCVSILYVYFLVLFWSWGFLGLGSYALSNCFMRGSGH